MESQELSLNCSCGGTLTLKISSHDKTAAGECACGRLVFWTRETGPAPVATPAPSVLGISVSDSVDSKDKFGG